MTTAVNGSAVVQQRHRTLRPGRAGLAELLLGVAALSLGGCAGIGATASPAPTAARTATPAGTYTSSTFRPAATVALPDGWVIVGDSAEQYVLQPVGSDVVGLYLFRSPQAASQEADCPIAPATDAGTTAAELVAWIRDRPGLVVSDPVPVTIGGLSGQQLDLAILDGWKASCPFADGLPTVPLFVSPTDPAFRWVIAGSERLRLAILDVPGDGTVVVNVDDFEGSSIDRLVADTAPIIGSLRFGSP